MCGGNRCTLVDNRRSDQILFDFYPSLIRGGSRFEVCAVEESKLRFPRQEGHPKWSLVIPHSKRVSINRIQNALEKTKGAVYLKPTKKGGANKPQAMWVYEGMLLQAHLSSSKCGLCNGCFYTVKEVGESITLENGTIISREFCAHYMRLTHALTLASSQGHTLHGRVRVYTHARMTNTHLLVAMSRCTSHALLEVV